MIFRHQQLPSTNDEAMRLALAGAEAFTAVVAERQSAGRGRNGHEWVSPEGVGLYASVVLRPRVETETLPVMTLLAGIAATEAIILLTDLPAKIKWPNDVLVNGKKVAGLLCEADLAYADGPIVIAGLGVNVNTPPQMFPIRSLYPATSLMAESGRCHERDALLDLWIERLRYWMGVLENNGTPDVLEAWRALDALAGEALCVALPDGSSVAGREEGVTDDGALLLRLADGSLFHVIAGDVSRCDCNRSVTGVFPR